MSILASILLGFIVVGVGILLMIPIILAIGWFMEDWVEIIKEMLED